MSMALDGLSVLFVLTLDCWSLESDYDYTCSPIIAATRAFEGFYASMSRVDEPKTSKQVAM